MIRRTLARLTTSSLAALTLVACQDLESPTAPRPRASAPRLSLYPSEQLDQQNVVANLGGSGGAETFGQSFTAGLTGQLTTVSIQIHCGRDIPDGVVEVYKGQYDWYNTDLVGFSPTPIASQPVPASVWPACPSATPQWIDFTFDTPASVVAGQVYTFRLKPSSPANIMYPATTAAFYAAGSAFGHSSYDILFKTYVLAGSAPADETPPVITPAVTGTLNNGWYTSNVNVSWTVLDAESAISTSLGCESITVSSDNTGATFTCSATSDGGSASQSVTVKRDATGPTLDPTVTPNPVLLNGSASAAPNASDAGGSGVASASCAAVVTSSVGAKTVACTATDNAGNQSTRSGAYSVFYPFTGFLGGVNAPPTFNSTKAGTSVQLKFSLGGNRGLAILVAGSPTSQSIVCGKPLALDEPVAVGGSGPTYDAKSGQYSYTWKTEKAWAGTCRKLSLKLVDGSEHTALFQFTK